MDNIGASIRRVAFMIGVLLLSALACNFQQEVPLDEPPSSTPSPESPGTSPEEEMVATTTRSAPETIPAAIATADAEAMETLAPTFTPILAPTLALTNTPTSTATKAATVTPSSGSGQPPGQNSGPLTFDYRVDWRFKDATALQSIATVTLTARGGGGGYRSFRDEQEVDGPTFEYEWASCNPNPITFRVTSASGEVAEKVLFLEPPCPTPTPTP